MHNPGMAWNTEMGIESRCSCCSCCSCCMHGGNRLSHCMLLKKKMIIQVHAGRPKVVPTSVLRKILQDALKMRVENFADKQSFKLEGVLLSGFPFNACYLSFQYLFLSTNVPEYCQLRTYLP